VGPPRRGLRASLRAAACARRGGGECHRGGTIASLDLAQSRWPASDPCGTPIADQSIIRIARDTSANTNVLNILPNGVQQPVSEWNAM
jgi:hypothetical protein